jgi:hypothetical protein
MRKMNAHDALIVHPSLTEKYIAESENAAARRPKKCASGALRNAPPAP